MKTLTLKPKKIRVWNRGQVTIPKPFRKDLGISDEDILNVVKIGDVIFLTTKKLTYLKLAREFRAIMKEKGITENDLLKELKNSRKEIYKEKYAPVS